MTGTSDIHTLFGLANSRISVTAAEGQINPLLHNNAF